MLRSMIAKYRGTCKGCLNPIIPGDIIAYVRKGAVYHVDCEGTKQITTIHFPSTGNTVFRNARGTCEDAPCCGCCTF